MKIPFVFIVIGSIFLQSPFIMAREKKANPGVEPSRVQASRVALENLTQQDFEVFSKQNSAPFAEAKDRILEVGRFWHDTQSSLVSLDEMLENRNYHYALRQLQQIIRRTQYPEIKKALEDFYAVVLKESKDWEEECQKELKNFFSKIASVCEKAQKPEEIDPLIEERENLYDRYNSIMKPRSVERLFNRLSNAGNFLEHWREYLDHRLIGNYGDAHESLKNLLNWSRESRPVPRPVIEKVIREVQQKIEQSIPDYDKILAQVTLDDIPKVISEINQQMNVDRLPIRVDLESLRDQLWEIYYFHKEQTAKEIRTGDFIIRRLPTRYHRRGRWAEAAQRLYDRLNKELFALYCEKEKLPKFKPDQTIDGYLRSTTKEMIKKQQWSEAAELLYLRFYFMTTSGESFYRQSERYYDEYKAMQSFIAGERLEAAGQPIAAAAAYRKALSVESPFLPYQIAIERLKKLGERYPAVIEETKP